jgi:hypothetical protein
MVVDPTDSDGSRSKRIVMVWVQVHKVTAVRRSKPSTELVYLEYWLHWLLLSAHETWKHTTECT